MTEPSTAFLKTIAHLPIARQKKVIAAWRSNVEKQHRAAAMRESDRVRRQLEREQGWKFTENPSRSRAKAAGPYYVIKAGKRVYHRTLAAAVKFGQTVADSLGKPVTVHQTKRTRKTASRAAR